MRGCCSPSKDPVGLAERIVDEGLSVRAVEAIAQAEHAGPLETKSAETRPAPGHRARIPTPVPSKRRWRTCSGLGVAIQHKAKGGEIRIRYKTLEQLDGLCRRLNPGG